MTESRKTGLGRFGIQPLIWQQHRLVLLDQTLLPDRIEYLRPRDWRAVVAAIQRLQVRGAPLIGVAAAFALAQEARRNPELLHLRRVAQELRRARPTAVNLGWAIERMEQVLGHPPARLAEALELEARTILKEEEQRSRKLAHYGAALIRHRARVMTICNAGRLAAPGLGTALAPIYQAHEQGRRVTVFVPETRPLLQGSRLTAFELSAAGIECVVLADSMIAGVMPDIDLVLVGADRIAANGDTANKIGTLQLALLARHYQRPFYVVARVSTIDSRTATGAGIPIEIRDSRELRYCGNRVVAPAQVQFHNPAFDVTPARLITALVTDQGILRRPLGAAIARLVQIRPQDRKGE